MSNFSLVNNIGSSSAQGKLASTSAKLNTTIQRLSSGLRITKSGDDAAGLAIANSYRSDVSVLSQGVRNANDGLSTLQIVDGGLNTISGLLDRAASLAAQSASGTFTGNRDTLQSELSKVTSEITRQAKNIGLAGGSGEEGRYNKSLNIFIGGGVDASGSTNLVSIDLSGAGKQVDASGLGLASLNIGATSVPTSATSTSLVSIGTSASVAGVASDVITTDPTSTTATAVSAPTSGVDGDAIAGDEQLTFNGADGKVFSINLTGGAAVGDIASAINDEATNDFVTAAVDADGKLTLTAKLEADGGTPQSFTVSSNRSANEVDQTGLEGAKVSYTKENTISADEKLTFNINGGEQFSVDLKRGDSADDIAKKINDSVGNKFGVEASVDSDGKLNVESSLTDANSKSFTVTSNRSASTSSSGLNNVSSAFTPAGLGADQELTFTVGENSFNVALKEGDSAKDVVSKINSAAGNTYGIKAAVGEGADVNSVKLTVDVSNANAGTFSVASDDNTSDFDGLEVTVTSASGGEAGAKAALEAIKSAVNQIGEAQGAVGAGQNNIAQAIDLASAQITNFQAAESLIRDADIAAEASNLARLNTLQQAGVSALAQANQSSQSLLSLLR